MAKKQDEFRCVIVRIHGLLKRGRRTKSDHRAVFLWNQGWEPGETLVLDEFGAFWEIEAEFREDVVRRMHIMPSERFREYLESIGNRRENLPDSRVLSSLIIAIKREDNNAGSRKKLRTERGQTESDHPRASLTSCVSDGDYD